MSINLNIWGSPQDYRDYQHNTDTIVDVKIPSLDKSSFYKTYGFNAPEDIDLSISPWGIGGGSWLCNTYGVACWIQKEGDNNPYNRENGFNVIHYNFDKYAGRQHPMILYSAYSDSNAFITPSTDVGKMPNTYRYYPQPSEDAASYSGKQPLTSSSAYSGWRRTPIVSFMYKNMILIPYIIGIAKNSGATVFTMFLDDFCNNAANAATTDNIAGWRANDVHIIGIGYMFANGNPTNRNISDDQSNLYCIGTQRELNNYIPPEPWYVDNLPPAAGNYPAEAKHVVMPSYTGQEGFAFHYSTCITSSCPIRAWNDLNSSPLNYWYGQYYVDSGLTYQTASAYFTGGENWKPACYIPGSDVPPTNGSTPKRYMYWDIENVSDDDVRAELWRQVAFLGFCFTTDHTKYNGTLGIDNELAMPVFDDGVTTGDYKSGINARELENFNWGNDIWDKNKYDPYNNDRETPPTPNPNPIYPSNPAFTLAGKGTSCYALLNGDMDDILAAVFGREDSDWDDLLNGLKFYGADPMAAIISYKWYPFSFDPTNTATVKLGGVEVSPTLYSYFSNVNETLHTDSFTFWSGLDKNFVNSRHIVARMWLPFYGFYSLPIQNFISEELEVEFHYNVPDELGVWIISFGNVIYDFLECNPSIDIPLSAIDYRGQKYAQLSGAMNYASSAINGLSGLVSGAASMATGGSLGLGGLETMRSENGYNSIGSMLKAQGVAGTMTAFDSDQIGTRSALIQGAGMFSSGVSQSFNSLGGAVTGIANNYINTRRTLNQLAINVPLHGAAGTTTFLNLPMAPYVQVFRNIVIDDYNEGQYRLKNGHACDKWVTAASMPSNSLCQTSGIADINTSGMELREVQELNSILQNGFFIAIE